MGHKRQDIYESSQRPSDGAGKNATDPALRNNEWYAFLRRSKRSGIVFRLIILTSIILMSLFIIDQMQRRRYKAGTAYDGPGNEKVSTIRTDSILNLEGDFESELIMDELLNMQPTPITDDSGTIEMNIHWVKQAAMHLVKAERAYNSSEWKEAIDNYNDALKIAPEIKGVDEKLGLCYMRMKDFNKSANAFGKVSGSATNSFRVLNNLGVARLASKDFSAAEKDFSSALKMQPNYTPSLHNMALLYYRTKMYEESIDYFERYFALQQNDLQTLQLYTDALIKLERWKDAAKALRTSAQQMPQAAPIFMSLAYVLSETGELDDAMANLNRGVSLMDRTKAMAIIAAPEYNALRQRQDFKELVNRLTSKNL